MSNASTTQPVYDRLLDAVFSGQFPPGSRLIERELAEQLGVSRVPVREALGRLVAQGVIEGGEHRRSVRMRRYSTDEIHQLFDFRQIIETGAVRAAAKAPDPDILKQLDDTCDRMQALVDQRDRIDQWVRLDHRFHDLIAEASGNQWIADTLKMLLRQSHYVFYRLRWRVLLDLSDEHVRKIRQVTVQAHREIVQHLRRGDGEGAAACMQWHIRQPLDEDRWPERLDTTQREGDQDHVHAS